MGPRDVNNKSYIKWKLILLVFIYNFFKYKIEMMIKIIWVSIIDFDLSQLTTNSQKTRGEID